MLLGVQHFLYAQSIDVTWDHVLDVISKVPEEHPNVSRRGLELDSDTCFVIVYLWVSSRTY